MCWWWTRVNRADISGALRAELEQYGEVVVAQILARPYTHAADQTAGVPMWVRTNKERKPVLAWLREQHNRAERKRDISETMELAILVLVGLEVIFSVIGLFHPTR
jgi:hypothetical protein